MKNNMEMIKRKSIKKDNIKKILSIILLFSAIIFARADITPNNSNIASASVSPGFGTKATFEKENNAQMKAKPQKDYNLVKNSAKVSNVKTWGITKNSTNLAEAKYEEAKKAKLKGANFATKLSGDIVPKSRGGRGQGTQLPLGTYELEAILKDDFDLTPKEILIPFGGTQELIISTKNNSIEVQWKIGSNSYATQKHKSYSFSFLDAKSFRIPTYSNKDRATIYYNTDNTSFIVTAKNAKGNERQAQVNIIGILSLSCSLEGNNPDVLPNTFITSKDKIETSNLVQDFKGYKGNVRFTATPLGGDKFPDGYPKWYVNGMEQVVLSGKASIVLDVGTLVKTNGEAVITAKCSEKEVNYKSVIDSNGKVTTNGNERFCSHSITFFQNSIQMTKPAGIYADPATDTSETGGWNYKQLDEDGKTITEKTTIPQSNEFIFDQNDDGKLTIHFEAKVCGSRKFRESLADGAFYFVPGDLENYATTDIVWKDGNGGSVESPCAYDPETGILSAEITYNKMPSSNAAFGYKTVKLMYKSKEGDVVEVTKSNYEVFFKKDGKKHPACTTCADCPNWFYYWKNGNACTLLGRAKFDSTLSDTTMGQYTNGSNIIRLGKNAASDYVEKITLKWNGNTVKIDCDAKKSNLRAVAITAKHELTHELLHFAMLEARKKSTDDLKTQHDALTALYNQYVAETKPAEKAQLKIEYEKAVEEYNAERTKHVDGTRYDADKDEVPNTLETTGNGIDGIAVKSDPNVADTYGLVSRFINNGMNDPGKIADYMREFEQKYPTETPKQLEARAVEKLRNEINAIYSGYNTYADNELRARVRSGKVSRGTDYFPEHDWASPGSNKN